MPSCPPETAREASPARSAYVGRFAPSPTGPLHFGSLVAALASYLDARHSAGRWLVRMEDVDETRCRPEWAGRILTQLEALGLHWDGPVWTQSARKASYGAALERLRQSGAAYACTCSRREIADASAQGIDGPVYPGTCRTGPARPGAEVAWRVRTDEAPILFDDAIQGVQTQSLGLEVGDFIVQRRDKLFAYQLAVVVDDAEQGVTQVVRGADLLDSTPRQIHLLRLLGHPLPGYAHVPVAVTGAGQKLSKQTLAPSIEGARSPGDLALMLNQALAFLGQAGVPSSNPQEVLARAVQDWDRHRVPPSRTRPAPSHLSS